MCSLYADRLKGLMSQRDALRNHLNSVLPDSCKEKTSEALIDALFQLFRQAPKQTIAQVISKHGTLVSVLMAMPHALQRED